VRRLNFGPGLFQPLGLIGSEAVIYGFLLLNFDDQEKRPAFHGS